MTNNNRPNLDAATIARLAASMRTANFDPSKGRTRPRTTHKRKNIR